MGLENSKNKKEINWEAQFYKLLNYCERNSFLVEITKNKISTIDFDDKIINIYKNHNLEHKFYILMHEIGHLELYKNKSNYRNNIFYGQKRFNKRSLIYKTSFLSEEIFAWNEGYKISKKLKLKVSKDNFEKFKTHCIVSHLNVLFKA